MKKKYVKIIEIYVDGCSKGNPGPSGAGVLIVHCDEILFEKGYYLGDDLTNNDAEYLAVLRGLSKASAYCMKTIEVKSDSELVIKQLNRQYKMRKEKHQEIHEKIRSKAQIPEKVVFIQVSRDHKYIKQADKLARMAVDKVKKGY
jgi:ribonuclease HI